MKKKRRNSKTKKAPHAAQGFPRYKKKANPKRRRPEIDPASKEGRLEALWYP